MAVPSNIAFGHYLRTLRERRSLSLDEVWSLSQTFPEPLNKGYLSRCENGKQKLALPKVIALSRIYEIPTDALVERLELDLELERFGGPPTEGLSFAQLRDAARNAREHGHVWAAYAFTRDASFVAAKATLDTDAYETIEDQYATSFINAASMAKSLGKYRYALHEFLHGEHSGSLGKSNKVLSAQRLAVTYGRLGKYSQAEDYADVALERLEESDRRFDAVVFEVHGTLKVLQGKFSEAIPWFQKSYEAAQSRSMYKHGAMNLLNIADAYHEAGNSRASRRTLQNLINLCEEHEIERTKALAWTVLGMLLEEDGQDADANRYFSAAASCAKALNDPVLRFQVEFYMYKHAVKQGRDGAARSVYRRLQRLALSVPDSVSQMAQFKSLRQP